jgi:catechol 2,3-dioxygenase-like lactoylglutathione lyase family enzyme
MSSGQTQTPVFNTQGKKIAQIGLVVEDAARTAKRYAEVFGLGPWLFFELDPTELSLHGRPVADGATSVRIAMANLGELQIELLEPMKGPSTYMEFFEEHGEGAHHLSFGLVEDHDDLLEAMKSQGFGVEMQGLLGGAYTFTYLETQKELGTIFEIVRPARAGVEGRFRPWGAYEPPGPGRVSLADKKIVQVGIVVENAERTARRYFDVFGLGPWFVIDFKPPHVAEAELHGVRMRGSDFHIRAALASLGPLQFELLEPVSGPSTHMDFLKRHGPGIHHVSFGSVADHDEAVAGFKSLGIEVEFTGLLGGAATFTYMATQKDLGTVFELVKVRPGVKSTVVPSGRIP